MLIGLNNTLIGKNNFAYRQSFGADLEVSEGTEYQYDAWSNRIYTNEHVKSLPVGDGKLKKITQLFSQKTQNIPGKLDMFIRNSRNEKGNSDYMYVLLRYTNEDYSDYIVLDKANYDTFGQGPRKWQNRDSYRRNSVEEYSSMFESVLNVFRQREQKAAQVANRHSEINSQIENLRAQKEKAIQDYDNAIKNLENDKVEVSKNAYKETKENTSLPFDVISDKGTFLNDDSIKDLCIWTL